MAELDIQIFFTAEVEVVNERFSFIRRDV